MAIQIIQHDIILLIFVEVSIDSDDFRNNYDFFIEHQRKNRSFSGSGSSWVWMAPSVGLEPTTVGLEVRRSIH